MTKASIAALINRYRDPACMKRRAAQIKLPDYLKDREREEGERFVGIASDGLKWVIFERGGDKLEKIKETILDPAKSAPFLAWLDGALALKASLPPEPLTIAIELGEDSVAYRRASEGLRALWARLKNDKAVHLKRQLWASLLKLVYGKEIEGDDLWFQHTYLLVTTCLLVRVSTNLSHVIACWQANLGGSSRTAGRTRDEWGRMVWWRPRRAKGTRWARVAQSGPKQAWLRQHNLTLPNPGAPRVSGRQVHPRQRSAFPLHRSHNATPNEAGSLSRHRARSR